MIFAEPSSQQFGIPEKLSGKVLGVTKLTNKDEENKYLDQSLLTHSKEYIKNSFKDSVKLFKTTIGKPLKTLVFSNKFEYHPHIPFKKTEICRKRINYLSKLENVSSYFKEKLGDSKIIWCEALRAAQLNFPVSVGKLPSQQNLFQIKRNFTGHLFPTYYYFDSQ